MYHVSAPYCTRQQMTVPILVFHLSAATSVKIINTTYTMLVSMRVRSVMFLNCFFGPHRNAVLRSARWAM